jgi:hypothetical protein
MSAAQVFFALDRKATKEFLATALKDTEERDFQPRQHLQAGIAEES